MRKFLVLASALALLSCSANAADITDLAEVVSVTPIKEFINEPRRECWTEPVTEYREYTEYHDRQYHSGTGAVIGGITGGLLGHNLGRGNGRSAGTVAGAVVGAIVGDRLDNHEYYSEPEVRREPVTRNVERCKSYDRYQAVVRRYHVVYRYNGREGEVTLPYDPGSHVRVGIQAIDGRESSQTVSPLH